MNGAPSTKGLNFQDLIRLRNPVNASQRGSFGPSSQEQGWVLRLAPQRGQSPLQSGLHSVLAGRDNSTCSRSTSSTNKISPFLLLIFFFLPCFCGVVGVHC